MHQRTSSIIFFYCLLALLSPAVQEKAPRYELVNTDVKRNLDLTSHVVKHTVAVSFVNEGSRVATIYEIILDKKPTSHLAELHVIDSAGKELPVSRASSTKGYAFVIARLCDNPLTLRIP